MFEYESKDIDEKRFGFSSTSYSLCPGSPMYASGKNASENLFKR